MSNLSRQQAVDAATQYLSEHAAGYFVTFNSLSKDRIKFNQQLQQVNAWSKFNAHRLSF